MPNPCRTTTRCLALATLTIGLLGGAGQLPGDEPAKPAPAVTPSDTSRLEKAQARLREVETSSELDEATKAKLLEAYRTVIARTESTIAMAGGRLPGLRHECAPRSEIISRPAGRR